MTSLVRSVHTMYTRYLSLIIDCNKYCSQFENGRVINKKKYKLDIQNELCSKIAQLNNDLLKGIASCLD